jgi:hypothetical protein
MTARAAWRPYRYSLVGILVACVYWLFDSGVHSFILEEGRFELIPSDFNELWTRTVIVALIAVIGVGADYHARKILEKQLELERLMIYRSTLAASHHIINNFLNQMIAVRMVVEASGCVSPEADRMFDQIVSEASGLLQNLTDLDEISPETIAEAVAPKKRG